MELRITKIEFLSASSSRVPYPEGNSLRPNQIRIFWSRGSRKLCKIERPLLLPTLTSLLVEVELDIEKRMMGSGVRSNLDSDGKRKLSLAAMKTTKSSFSFDSAASFSKTNSNKRNRFFLRIRGSGILKKTAF